MTAAELETLADLVAARIIARLRTTTAPSRDTGAHHEEHTGCHDHDEEIEPLDHTTITPEDTLSASIERGRSLQKSIDQKLSRRKQPTTTTAPSQRTGAP